MKSRKYNESGGTKKGGCRWGGMQIDSCTDCGKVAVWRARARAVDVEVEVDTEVEGDYSGTWRHVNSNRKASVSAAATAVTASPSRVGQSDQV